MEAARASRVRCSKCSAPVRWTAGEPAVACEFCGATETLPVPDAQIVEHDLALAMNRRDHLGYTLPVRRVKCGQCNAVVAFEPGVSAGQCAFCGSAAVADVAGGERHFRPESLLPFAVDRVRAGELFREWVKGVSWAPADLKKKAALQELTGVYLPFWTFDASAKSGWRARVGHLEEAWVEVNGNKYWKETTRWEDASGRHEQHYDDVLVDASRGLPKELRTGIEPFDTSKLVPWDARYIAGFAAEEYAIDALQGWGRAQADIREREREACLKQVPGNKHKDFGINTECGDVTFKHALLPVWIATYTYKDKTFRFLINGQTGKVHGDSPESWIWSALVVVLLLGVLGLGIWLTS